MIDLGDVETWLVSIGAYSDFPTRRLEMKTNQELATVGEKVNLNYNYDGIAIEFVGTLVKVVHEDDDIYYIFEAGE